MSSHLLAKFLRFNQFGRPLSALEKQRYQAYFSSHLLSQVRVVEEGEMQANGRLGKVPFWLFRHMHGLVLGNVIYFRKDAYRAETHAGVELLAHELTHVQQFFAGMTIAKYLWQSRKGYRNNPYEREAYANGARISRALNCSKKKGSEAFLGLQSNSQVSFLDSGEMTKGGKTTEHATCYK